MLKLRKITSAKSNYWQEFVNIYHATFPAWEREAEDVIAERVQSGRYQLCVGIDKEVVGFYIYDLVADLNYAILTYLAVVKYKRNQGYGVCLCQDVIKRCKIDWLLVEAESPILYKKLGFKSFNFNYQVPKFADTDSIPMYLLAINNNGQNYIGKDSLVKIIKYMFINDYQLKSDDNRIYEQILRIPNQVQLIDSNTLRIE